MISSTKGEVVFTETGFQNWKKKHWLKTKDFRSMNRQNVTKKLQQGGARFTRL